MKTRLYLCIKNPLVERDVERLGVAELGERYELRILDCTAWLMPAAFRTRGHSGLDLPNLRRIASLAEFKAALETGGFALDCVGPFSPQAILMFDALRQRGIRLIVLDSGAFPAPETTLGRRNLARKLLDALRHGGLRAHLLARLNRLLLRLLPDQRPDLALVAGESWRADPRFASARRQVGAHSFDYERFRAVCARPLPDALRQLSPCAVYLDEDIAGHEDNVEMGLPAPTSEARFYPALNRFFDRFERATGLAVVIAGYPSRKQGACERFGGRPVFFGLSAELISTSRVVFAHASTAISFAVLWRRPLAFLTSGDITASWYGPWVESPRALLRAPLIDLDAEAVLPDCERFDESAYAAYERAYIKSAGSPDASLWDIMTCATRELESLPA
jgi:hypothetical protein